MQRGFISFPRVVERSFESDLRDVSLTAETVWDHGFGRPPTDVDVVLVCQVANNGYLPGDEIPLEAVVKDLPTGNRAGMIGSYVIRGPFTIRVRVGAATGAADVVFSGTGLGEDPFVAAEWKMKCYARCFAPI